ncbi:hypothetical protein MCOR29_007547 [Pyricularia oryzae]|uniref:Uncharacterized protein n=1 Tax=Pyricularia grisea TaxID=148305 RepID=A0ABQ8NA92_PYRGI|nr:hypothetical protein MCOR01_009988 [Pyricularia oryzae]KAI6293816.1 hypothetical protein MCOR33_008888 [Pyricularia grisea]KAI6258989.1 hypothetical protein MCOR19_004643 [Pyricularia oryzae]KAI6290567.1 hypothetical protein MCOR34_010368 [Pyricularia oryzae]KAI6310443.1 hypothetical protein MCOR30_011118 [Pyricularia oryzae]
MRFQTAILAILATAHTGSGATTDSQQHITECQNNIASYQRQITECQNRITNYQNQITEFQKQIDHPEPQERGNWGACMTKCMIKWGKRIPGKKSDAGCLVFCDSQCMKLQNYLPSEDRVRGVCILKALDDGRDEHV